MERIISEIENITEEEKKLYLAYVEKMKEQAKKNKEKGEER